MTYLIRVESGSPEGTPLSFDEFVKLFPRSSFPQPLTPADVIGTGYALFVFTAQPQVSVYEKLVETTPVLESDDAWHQVWQVVEMTPEEKKQVDDRQAEYIRSIRNIKLQNCDWTQLGDAPLDSHTKLLWAQYREELRDVTSQPGFPWNVTWPLEPGA